MGWLGRHRWWVRGVLALVIIALLSVDGVVVAHRTHLEAVHAAQERAAAAARRAVAARVAYVRALRTPLVAVYRTVQPLQNDLDLRGTHPNAGIDYPVRDALAHSTAPAALRQEIAAVAALHPPSSLQARAAAVRTALTQLSTLTQSLAAHAGDQDDTLGDDLDGGVFSDLTSDESSLESAIDAVYLPTQVAEPPVAGPGGGTSPIPLAPSHDSWLLATDSACNDGALVLAGIPAGVPSTTTALRSAVTLEIRGVSLTAREIAAAKPPAHDAAAAAIVAQLPLVDKLISYEQQGLSDNEAGSLSASATALEEGAALLPDLNALGRAFNAYGATVCSAVFGAASGSSGGGSGSGGSGGGATAAA